jgi:hypothetical protein
VARQRVEMLLSGPSIGPNPRSELCSDHFSDFSEILDAGQREVVSRLQRAGVSIDWPIALEPSRCFRSY